MSKGSCILEINIFPGNLETSFSDSLQITLMHAHTFLYDSTMRNFHFSKQKLSASIFCFLVFHCWIFNDWTEKSFVPQNLCFFSTLNYIKRCWETHTQLVGLLTEGHLYKRKFLYYHTLLYLPLTFWSILQKCIVENYSSCTLINHVYMSVSLHPGCLFTLFFFVFNTRQEAKKGLCLPNFIKL